MNKKTQVILTAAFILSSLCGCGVSVGEPHRYDVVRESKVVLTNICREQGFVILGTNRDAFGLKVVFMDGIGKLYEAHYTTNGLTDIKIVNNIVIQ